MKTRTISELFNMKAFIHPIIILILSILLILNVIVKNNEISKLEQENQKYFDALIGCMITKVSHEERI